MIILINLSHEDLNLIPGYHVKFYQNKKSCYIANFDNSTIIRFSKQIRSLILLYDNYFGVGFWGSQYIYNFLSDSILQFFLEIGLFGILILIFNIIYIIKFFKKSKIGQNILSFIPFL